MRRVVPIVLVAIVGFAVGLISAPGQSPPRRERHADPSDVARIPVTVGQTGPGGQSLRFEDGDRVYVVVVAADPYVIRTQ